MDGLCFSKNARSQSGKNPLSPRYSASWSRKKLRRAQKSRLPKIFVVNGTFWFSFACKFQFFSSYAHYFLGHRERRRYEDGIGNNSDLIRVKGSQTPPETTQHHHHHHHYRMPTAHIFTPDPTKTIDFPTLHKNPLENRSGTKLCVPLCRYNPNLMLMINIGD